MNDIAPTQPDRKPTNCDNPAKDNQEDREPAEDDLKKTVEDDLEESEEDDAPEKKERVPGKRIRKRRKHQKKVRAPRIVGETMENIASQ